MRIILVLVITLLSNFCVTAQGIMGEWNGVLSIQGTQLRLVFHISQNDTVYTSTMDSPDQGAKGIPVTTTTFKDGVLTLGIPAGGIVYTGEYKDSSVVGVFTQNGRGFPLTLTREAAEKAKLNRPQEPVEPYPYHSENVTFENREAEIELAGTLTLPKKEGVFPAVILISGSGPQDRNEELMGHKPFLVISDYLTRNGIAVLRYDDRGVGESKGDFGAATSADFAGDVAGAVAYLKTRKEIDPAKIGLIGHSEGGMIAPMVASESEDVGFIVLLAGSGIRGDKLILLQEELINRISGKKEEEIAASLQTSARVYDAIIGTEDNEALKSTLQAILEESIAAGYVKIPDGSDKDKFIRQQLQSYTSPWVRYFLEHNPAGVLEKVKCPVLAVNGEKDLQVPPKENLSAIKNALEKGGNKHVTITEYPNLNHLFQESDTGSPMEYAAIEQTFSPEVLKDITEWINLQTGGSL